MEAGSSVDLRDKKIENRMKKEGARTRLLLKVVALAHFSLFFALFICYPDMVRLAIKRSRFVSQLLITRLSPEVLEVSPSDI